MSWKILVSAGLLCIVASPVFAVGPTASSKLLGLDVNGNWVWSVSVTPDASLFSSQPPNGTGGSVAIEVGATSSKTLVSAAANTTNFPNNNPGTSPFAAPINGTQTGVVTNIPTNQVFAGLGSTFFTAAGAEEAFRVHAAGPTSTALTASLTLSGAYTGNGRLAQAGTNYDVATGVTNGAVRGGNANLTDHVDVGDLAILGSHYDTAHAHPGQHWQTADFTGDGFVDVGDLAVLGANYNQADTNWTVAGQVNIAATPGAGAGSSSAVPEPASIVLLGLGGIFLAARRFRRGR
jgi:hypothetical protein